MSGMHRSVEPRYSADDFEAFTQYVNPTLGKFLALTGRDAQFVQANNNRMVTRDGRVFRDWISGFGSVNLGHNPERPLAALRNFANAGSPNLFVEGLNPAAGRLAKRLMATAGESFETCFFSNSGSEAVESALKLAVAATGRSMVVHCRGAYHGTTLGALRMMARGSYRDPFEPVLHAWRAIDFNDIEALEQAMNEQVAAIVIEPVQIESGIHAATSEFLRAAKRLSTQFGALLIFDEVQTGMSRIGYPFAFMRDNVIPDVLCLAKGLGCGLVPIGATLAAKGLFSRAYGSYERSESHNSTYGGNALACEVALAGAEELFDGALLAHVRDCGHLLTEHADALLRGHPLVEGYRFYGLMGGVQLKPVDHPWFDWAAIGLEEWTGKPVTGPLLVHRLYQRGFLVQPCAHQWNCIRVQPPLTVGISDCVEFITHLRGVLDWILDHG